MHFLSFVIEDKGLYIGVHDPLQRPGEASLSNGQDLVIRQFPDNMGTPGTGYKSDFPVVVKLHDGDWWKAAKIYRQWVTTLPRLYNKPLNERNLPVAFMEAGIWMNMWQSPKAVAEIVVNMEKYFGVSAGVFWCEWGQHVFDRNLPEFFPFRPDMVESVKKMEDSGTAVMPYTNARVWGQDNKEFNSTAVQEGLVRDYSGKLKIETFGAKLGVMCPAYPMWREKVLEINRKLINEANVNTVYWDQVGAAVRASLWKHADGDLGIAMINFSGSAQTFSFKLDTAQYSGLKSDKWQVAELTPAGEKIIGESGNEVSCSEQIEPYSAKFLALRKIK